MSYPGAYPGFYPAVSDAGSGDGRTTVQAQQVTLSGLDPVLTPATAAGDSIPPGRVGLLVQNAGTASVTVTVQTPGQFDGMPIAELEVAVPAASRRLIGTFPASVFGRPFGLTDPGRVHVSYSATDGVSRAVISL